MILKDWIETNNNLPNYALKDLKNLEAYLYNTYGTYELKFSNDLFDIRLKGLVIKYNNLLKPLESSIDIVNNNELTFDKLGNVSNRTSERSDSLKSNYEGFSNVGAFSSGNSENTINTKEQKANYLDSIFKLNNLDTYNMWLAFEKEFIKLLITLYGII